MNEGNAAQNAETSLDRRTSDTLFLVPRVFADQVPADDRRLQLRSAIERGRYRIPTHVLAACLMFEMLH